MGKFRARMGAAWAAWKKKHWDIQYGVGAFSTPGLVFSGSTVIPRLRRIARWFARVWEQKPIEVLALIVATLGLLWAVLRG